MGREHPTRGAAGGTQQASGLTFETFQRRIAVENSRDCGHKRSQTGERSGECAPYDTAHHTQIELQPPVGPFCF